MTTTDNPRQTYQSGSLDESTLATKAHAAIVKAQITFTMRMPFLSTPLLRLPIKALPPSVCPTLATDGFYIFYNPSFVLTLKPDEVCGALAHELMHVLMDHQARKKQRNNLLWNIACDYAINQILKDLKIELPYGALYHPAFNEKTAEEIYDELLREQKKANNFGVPFRLPNSRYSIASGSGDDLPIEVAHDLLDPTDPRVTIFLDNKIDNEYRQAILKEVRITFKEGLKQQGHHLYHYFTSLLDLCGSQTIDWRTLLRQWLFDRLKTDWSMWPPSKRHIWQGLYLPSVGQPAPGHVYLIVDTSGSMSDRLIAQIFGELRSFRETFPSQLSIVEADTVVRHVRHFDAYETFSDEPIQVHGRGGTSFIEPLAWVEKHRENQHSVVIYVTDGYGEFPIQCNMPNIWLVTRDGLDNRYFPKWATVVRMTLE